MNVSAADALELVRVFARAEYALKRVPTYCREERGRAAANWSSFDDDVADLLVPRIDAATRRLLTDAPPMIEVVELGVGVFRDRNLSGPPGKQMLQAARRVRNNLFHGGKELPERHTGHDGALV